MRLPRLCADTRRQVLSTREVTRVLHSYDKDLHSIFRTYAAADRGTAEGKHALASISM